MSRGLLDTSVLADHDRIDSAKLLDESVIAAISLAELSAGPHATTDDPERPRRQDRLQWVVAHWDALPFDADAARACGLIFAAVPRAGRTSRARVVDLLIASTALANDLPLYTRNPASLAGLEDLVQVHAV